MKENIKILVKYVYLLREDICRWPGLFTMKVATVMLRTIKYYNYVTPVPVPSRNQSVNPICLHRFLTFFLCVSDYSYALSRIHFQSSCILLRYRNAAWIV